MSVSKRQQILAEFVNRLYEITIANGFQTDAGQLVFIGERPVLGPSDPDASIDVVVSTDDPGFQGEKVFVTLPVTVRAVVRVDSVNGATPWGTVEAVIADIKKAIETDHDLSGLLVQRGLERGPVEPRDREPGDEIVGAGVQYNLKYTEQWGAP